MSLSNIHTLYRTRKRTSNDISIAVQIVYKRYLHNICVAIYTHIHFFLKKIVFTL